MHRCICRHTANKDSEQKMDTEAKHAKIEMKMTFYHKCISYLRSTSTILLYVTILFNQSLVSEDAITLQSRRPGKPNIQINDHIAGKMS